MFCVSKPEGKCAIVIGNNRFQVKETFVKYPNRKIFEKHRNICEVKVKTSYLLKITKN